MKITKSYLKQIIKEELNHMEESQYDDDIKHYGYVGGEPNYERQVSVIRGHLYAAVKILEAALPKLSGSGVSEVQAVLEKLTDMTKRGPGSA